MKEPPVFMPPGVSRVLLPAERIQARVLELGEQISRDYAGREPMFVGVLKGSLPFLADLLRAVRLPCSVEFVSLASYAGRGSTGAVQVLLDLRESAEGKDLIVVEDIVDTGLTLNYLLQSLRARKPRSLEVCALLDKPECRKAPAQPKYLGFSIPNEFVVGYGLDFNEKYRNLPFVGVLRPQA